MKSFLLFLAPLFMIQLLEAQNVGIGTITPQASSILDIKSNNKGVLLPRASTITQCYCKPFGTSSSH